MLAMRQDRRVMATLGPIQSRADVEQSFLNQQDCQRRFGHCSWIVEERETSAVLGTAGFQPIIAGTPVTTPFEIGWKLRYEAWGRGYAFEAASAAIDWWWAEDKPDPRGGNYRHDKHA